LDGDNIAERVAGFPLRPRRGDIARALAIERGDDTGSELLFWAEAARNSIETHRRDLGQSADAASSVEARLTVLEESARGIALSMDFRFLLDRNRKLLSIGYRVPEGTLDPSCYDLLASEARLASFVASPMTFGPHWFTSAAP
jgi:cyclic beta-1,2-glucan synthetase